MPFINGSYKDPRQFNYQFLLNLQNSNQNTESNSGTGAGTSNNSEAGYADTMVSLTGSTSTGQTGVRSVFILGGGGDIQISTACKIPTLSTVSEEFTFEIGWFDGTTTISNGAYFRYDRLTNTNWLAITESSGTETSTDTGTAVGTSTVSFTIEINSALNNVEFYINGSNVATHTTNIPSIGCYLHTLLTKSAGTGNRQVETMYWEYIQDRGSLLT